MKTKKQIILFCIFFITFASFSQTNFEKGSFITNSGELVNCLIKNVDWKNNPTKFQYRFTESDDIKEKNIKQVKLFEIFENSKYIKKTVNIDRSGVQINELSYVRNPKFKEEVLFLKVLIEGDADLYKYEDGDIVRFFYDMKNTETEQLVFKEYRTNNDNNIHQNNLYKQQLINTLKCETFSTEEIIRIDYNIDDLTNLFEKYNNCINSTEDVVNYEKKVKRDLLNIRLKAGFGQSSLFTNNDKVFGTEPEFDKETIFRYGAELELLLPFNNNKWSFVAEPSFQSYSSTTYYPDVFGNAGAGGTVDVDYSTFELPLGIRHYLFLNDDSKIFINTFYSLIFTGDSQIIYDQGYVLELEKAGGFSFGIGYSYKNYSFEFRNEFSREILANTYQSWESEFNQISLIFGYQIF